MGIKILPTRKFFDEDISYLKSKLNADCQILEPKSFDEPELLKYAQDADIFLGPVISKELCKAAPKLKFIQIPWTGVDNLNFQLIEEVGVTVCNSHSNAYAVAEHAVALMLDVAKKITYHDSEFRNGNWNRPRPDGTNEVSPFSKRISNSDVGIIGFGHIGRNIYDFLQGFKCKFHIADTTVNEIHSKNGIIFYPPQLISEFFTMC
jgi:lactate dehydrogenase-like 2-hydroxyacid dehydrogenase